MPLLVFGREQLRVDSHTTSICHDQQVALEEVVDLGLNLVRLLNLLLHACHLPLQLVELGQLVVDVLLLLDGIRFLLRYLPLAAAPLCRGLEEMRADALVDCERKKESEMYALD